MLANVVVEDTTRFAEYLEKHPQSSLGMRRYVVRAEAMLAARNLNAYRVALTGDSMRKSKQSKAAA